MRRTADVVARSASLRALAVDPTEIANGLRLMASGPHAGLGASRPPGVQPGSSIMPRKVKPVIGERQNMRRHQALGVDLTVATAGEAGQLESASCWP